LKDQFYSFILDPFLLISGGIFIIWLSRKNPWLILILPLFLALVLSIGLLLYFDLLSVPGLGDYGKGNHFMWNSGIELFGFKSPVLLSQPSYFHFFSVLNLSALAIFVFLYPIFLLVGIKIGQKIFN
jgi:hypothetical protein